MVDAWETMALVAVQVAAFHNGLYLSDGSPNHEASGEHSS